jgi:hypothetical protein
MANTKVPLKVSTNRYLIGFVNNTLWVNCRECKTEIFGWREDLPLALVLLGDAVERHENIWHAPQTLTD